MNYLLQHKLISHHVAMNTHDNIDIVYLDFSKAFDSVVHSKLIAKLACYGIDRVLLSWIGSFLSNRF